MCFVYVFSEQPSYVQSDKAVYDFNIIKAL